jgi:hypothetical protein
MFSNVWHCGLSGGDPPTYEEKRPPYQVEACPGMTVKLLAVPTNP